MATIWSLVVLTAVLLDRLASSLVWWALVKRSRRQDLPEIAKHFAHRH